MKKEMHETSLQPWLTVRDGEQAVSFYKSAFGATETHRQSHPDGALVVRLSVGNAVFWVSSDARQADNSLEVRNVRMILVVDDPDSSYDRAIAAGARQAWPVGEEYGWRIGRLIDPFGMHWEIGHEL